MGIDTSGFVILLQVPVFLLGGIVPWSWWHGWWHCALVSVLPAAGLRLPHRAQVLCTRWLGEVAQLPDKISRY